MSHPVRRVSAMLALAVAALVSLATSYATYSVDISAHRVSGTMTLDAEHPVAVQRLVVTYNDVSMTGSHHQSIVVSRLDQTSARLTIVAVDPNKEAGLAAAPGYGYEPSEPRQLSPGSREEFTIECTGPCQRSFRLIAESAGNRSATVSWEAGGSISYLGSFYPSGAGVDLHADDPIAVGGKGRTAHAELLDQSIQVDATHPVAARLVELKLPVTAVPANAADAVTTVVFEATSPLYPGDTSGHGQVALSEVVPERNATGWVDAAGFDPLSGCAYGAECTKTYLVTASWSGGGGVEQFVWSLTLNQIRLAGEPAADGSISMRVARTIDVAAAAPSTIRLEGDVTVLPAATDTLSASTAVGLGIRPVSGADAPLLRLLPVPAVASFRTTPVRGSGHDPSVTVTAELDWGASKLASGQGDSTSTLNVPLAGAWPASGPLQLRVIFLVDQRKAKLAGPLKLHWRLDVAAYRYQGLPAAIPWRLDTAVPAT